MQYAHAFQYQPCTGCGQVVIPCLLFVRVWFRGIPQHCPDLPAWSRWNPSGSHFCEQSGYGGAVRTHVMALGITTAVGLAVVVASPTGPQSQPQALAGSDGARVIAASLPNALIPDTDAAQTRNRTTKRARGATFRVAPGSSGRSGPGRLTRFRVEVQRGINSVKPAEFATAVEDRLFDHRGWAQKDNRALQRVSAGKVKLAVTLAKPKTVDRLCYPYRTAGFVSCFNAGRAVINLQRWRKGAPDFPTLEEYRTYLINHEVGHGFGKRHWYCPKKGGPGRLMMQQTFTLSDTCTPQNLARPKAPRFVSQCRLSSRIEDGQLYVDGNVTITPKPLPVELIRSDRETSRSLGLVETTVDGGFSVPLPPEDLDPSTESVSMRFLGDRDLAECDASTGLR